MIVTKALRAFTSFALILALTACAAMHRNNLREEMRKHHCYQVSIDEGQRFYSHSANIFDGSSGTVHRSEQHECWSCPQAGHPDVQRCF